jgi:hypothetical protein
VPLYGSGHKAVDPEKASEWLDLLLDAHSRNIEGALFAIVQLARLSGDRSRDIDDYSVRARSMRFAFPKHPSHGSACCSKSPPWKLQIKPAPLGIRCPQDWRRNRNLHQQIYRSFRRDRTESIDQFVACRVP